MAETYLPIGDSELVVWFGNFQSKLSGYASTLGVAASEVSAVGADYDQFVYTVNQVEVFKIKTRERVAYKDTLKDGPLGAPAAPAPALPTFGAEPAPVPPGIVPRLRALVQRIKNHPNFSEAMGRDLGILAPAPPPPGVPKPTVRNARPLPMGQIEVVYSKGKFTGVLIESRRAGENAWSRLDKSFRSPFTDERALLTANQPELRDYRLRYLDGDQPAGDYSDVVTVTASP